MSHLTLAQQGIAAVEQRDFDTAITKLTSALQISLNPSWLVQRSKALNGAGFHTASLADADLAWHAAVSRNRRELIAEANYRRAVACNRLGRFADAATCAAYAMRIYKEDGPLLAKDDPKNAWVDAKGRCTLKLDEVKAATKEDKFNKPLDGSPASQLKAASDKVKAWRIASVLQIQALVAMEKLDEDDEARIVTVSQKPEKQGLSNPQKTAGTGTAPAKPVAPPTPAAATASAPKPATLRLDNYQSDTQLTVSLFSKGVDKSRLKVEFLPFAVNLDPVVFPGGEEKSYTLNLWGEIDTENSTHRVTPSKIELVLKKKTTGKWAQVVKDETEAGPNAQSTEQTAIKKPAPIGVPIKEQDSQPPPETKSAASEPTGQESQSSAGPSYPTSSRSGPKNWDKLEGLEGGDSDDESDVNQFFKKIYKGATPEQQRAMMKSFTESNGTSLSTDWDDVKGRKVETMPPEGVEAKKWT